MLSLALLPLMVGSANPPETIYDFRLASIEGKAVPLKEFKGKVLLVVNVASKCGLTPQYEGLEKLYRDHKSSGFAVLGFPANEFGNQEPGSNEQIREFCTKNYGVTFPMFEKIVVKGEGTHLLYRWLIAQSDRPGDEIGWNFAKFLISRDGKVLKRFTPKTKPDDPDLVAAIRAALEAK
ncbi:MAG TPA: glutathione peroxidase [Fimbriimonadaceae bacterium]|nr:glutathione peroxidase [Fimbriimonadaceae bacterium]